jgi:hypothetical protein
MNAYSQKNIPVLLRFSDDAGRSDTWGRLQQLAPLGAELCTRTRLEAGERLWLDFELPGEPLRGLAADIAHVHIDEDGYRVLRLVFPLADQRTDLGRRLRRLLVSAVES